MLDIPVEIKLLNRRVAREKSARKQAEEILNQKSLQLYNANQALQRSNQALDQRVRERTLELEKAKIYAEQQAAVNKKTKERFQLAMLASTVGIWEKNIAENSWYFSAKLINFLGYATTELINQFETFSFIHPEDVNKLKKAVLGHIQHHQVFDVECRVLTKSGTYKWFWIVGQAEWGISGELIRIAGSLSDIDERIETAKLIHKMAHFDHLTQVPNRGLFNKELDKLLVTAKQQGSSLAVLLIDLNDFKSINDSLGHSAGDALLLHVAAQLKKNIHQHDLIARLGGDEFAIVLSHLNSHSELSSSCEKLIKGLKNPLKYNNSSLLAKISIGVALYPEHGLDRGELLSNADLAMYQAKKSKFKGSYFYICRSELIERQAMRCKIAKDIYTAIKNRQFYMLFQPFVELATGRLNMAESLVRWNHPVMGELSPVDFIPIAEESGLIVELGELIIEMVIPMVEQLIDAGALKRISINISAAHFLAPSFLVILKENLVKYPNAAQYLCIEITESVLIDNVELARSVIKKLHNLGLIVSLDDFGTGYSSLSYLQLLSVDSIKLDRTFIADLDLNDERRIITKAIIELAHSLNLSVVAEGVENSRQLDYLIEYQCNYIQGNYFYKPMAVEELVTVLADYQFIASWKKEPITLEKRL